MVSNYGLCQNTRFCPRLDLRCVLKTVKPCSNYSNQICRIEARIPGRIRGGPYEANLIPRVRLAPVRNFALGQQHWRSLGASPEPPRDKHPACPPG